VRATYIIIGLLLVCIPTAHAATPLTFRHTHHLFTLTPTAAWRSRIEQWFYGGKAIVPPSTWRVDADEMPFLPEGVTKRIVEDWDPNAIRVILEKHIATKLNRPTGSVRIMRGTGSDIIFDGIGLPGREVDLDQAVLLALAALNSGATDVVLPVRVTQPSIEVLDAELTNVGIREVVTVGESNFAGSPAARRHNISVGLSKFNGTLIPQGSVLTFGTILGKVNAAAGYWKELVIKGAKTEPDYGGGLCQVSTTAYRGVWEHGFPILKRTNHSYAVSYYGPQGSDATVYPPNPDMSFLNDGPSALLIQTHQENDNAYFIYYGTRDERTAEVIGPFVWGRSAPPPDRTEYTTEIPVGTKRKVGDRHAGLKALWYRFVTTQTGSLKTERVYSYYEPRPLFYQVGVAASPGGELGPEETAPVIPEPDWIGL
jgi:vancomycin resistance protein YoaR